MEETAAGLLNNGGPDQVTGKGRRLLTKRKGRVQRYMVDNFQNLSFKFSTTVKPL